MHPRSKVAPAFSLCMCIADANICKLHRIYGLHVLFIARELINVKLGKRFLTPTHLLSVVGDFFMPPPLQVDIVVCSVSENENTNKYMCSE